MVFDPNIKSSEIAAIFSFILAVLVFVYSKTKDTKSLDRDRASNARILLTDCLSKIERWDDICLSIFDAVQPIIIETSELWVKEQKIFATRDYFWRQLAIMKASIKKNILDEKINTSYVNLYRIDYALAIDYQKTVTDLYSINERNHNQFNDVAQREILSFENFNEEKIAAYLGNALRSVVSRAQTNFTEKSSQAKNEIKEKLLNILQMDDSELLAYIKSHRKPV